MLKRATYQSLMLAAVIAWMAIPAWAEPISVQDREEIGRLRAAQGFSAEEVNLLIEQVNKAGEKGIPPEPLANKVKEGLAKGIDPKRIDPVLRQMVTHFDTAQSVLQEAAVAAPSRAVWLELARLMEATGQAEAAHRYFKSAAEAAA